MEKLCYHILKAVGLDQTIFALILVYSGAKHFPK